ncbi:MAG: peptidase [Blastococcus sp.]|jgi:hypothetical protein|nr:peptidase [Blastococcus sp.]
MRAIPVRSPGRSRLASSGFVAVAVAVLMVFTAGPASAVAPGSYSISAGGGAVFAQLSSNNLVSGPVDDALFFVSTTGSGLGRLPFPLHLYNQTYVNAAISSNGNIQPGISSGGTTAFTNNCLPSATFGRSVVLPFWDDLFFDSNDTAHGFIEGVFTRTSGSAPHRKFLVSWQGHLFSDAGSIVMAQVTFNENSQTVTYAYGRSGGGSATVGIQAKQQLSSTEWTCNSGLATAVQSGMRLTFLHN